MGMFDAMGSAMGMGGGKPQMGGVARMKQAAQPQMGSAMGQQQNPGLGPSMGAMGGMMGRKMGQQQQMPGNRMGQQMGLGGFQQQRQVGRNRQMPMKPRQDMQDMGGQVGMSSATLPGYGTQGSAPNDMMGQEQDLMIQQQMQQAMQQKQAMMGRGMGPRQGFWGNMMGRMGQAGSAMGPNPMQQRYEQQQPVGYGTSVGE